MKFTFFLLLILVPAFACAQAPQTTYEEWRATRDTNSFKDEFIEVSEEPKPLQNIQAIVTYLRKTMKAGIQGKVIYSALIDTNGNVEKVRIDKSDNIIFNQAVIDAVKNTKFTPAIGSDTKPVRVWYTQTINFKLKSTVNGLESH